MREYDEVTLKKVQQIELGILKDFIEVCEKNKLTYFGVGGTSIGAIRHSGFIPWDDDIDIGMPREDYNKFIKIAKSEYADRYIVLSGEEYENCPVANMRWVKKETVFIEEAFKNISNCPFGIFLDIFPFDKIPNDDKLFKKQARAAFIYSKLLILRSLPFPVLPIKGWKAKVIHAICFCIHWVLRILRVSKTFLHRKCIEVSTKYNDMKDAKRINYLCDTTPYMNIHDIAGTFPLKQLPFEDIMLNVSGNVEEVLSKKYGDYMQLPPVEKRKNHFPYKLDFGNEK